MTATMATPETLAPKKADVGKILVLSAMSVGAVATIAVLLDNRDTSFSNPSTTTSTSSAPKTKEKVARYIEPAPTLAPADRLWGSCADYADKVTFIDTTHPAGSQLVPITEANKSEIKRYLGQTCAGLLEYGYDRSTLQTIIENMNTAVVTNTQQVNRHLVNRPEIIYGDWTAIRHEFLHELFYLQSDSINVGVLYEAQAYRNEARILNADLDDPLLHTGDFLRYKLPGVLKNKNYADAAKALDRVDAKLDAKGKNPKSDPLDIILIKAYQEFAFKIPFQSRWSQEMPDSFLFNVIAREKGISMQDVQSILLSEPLFALPKVATKPVPTPQRGK